MCGELSVHHGHVNVLVAVDNSTRSNEIIYCLARRRDHYAVRRLRIPVCRRKVDDFTFHDGYLVGGEWGNRPRGSSATNAQPCECERACTDAHDGGNDCSLPDIRA